MLLKALRSISSASTTASPSSWSMEKAAAPPDKSDGWLSQASVSISSGS